MVGAGRRSEPTGADATRPARECSRRPRRPDARFGHVYSSSSAAPSSTATCERVAVALRSRAWLRRYRWTRGRASNASSGRQSRRSPASRTRSLPCAATTCSCAPKTRRTQRLESRSLSNGFKTLSTRCTRTGESASTRPRRRIAARSLRDVGGGPPGLHDYDIVDGHVDQLAARRRER